MKKKNLKTDMKRIFFLQNCFEIPLWEMNSFAKTKISDLTSDLDIFRINSYSDCTKYLSLHSRISNIKSSNKKKFLDLFSLKFFTCSRMENFSFTFQVGLLQNRINKKCILSEIYVLILFMLTQCSQLSCGNPKS